MLSLDCLCKLTSNRTCAVNLPFPTAPAVQEFQTLYRAEFGIALSDDEAWEAATLILQLYYLCTYGVFSLHPQKPGG